MFRPAQETGSMRTLTRDFLVVGHGAVDEMTRAKVALDASNPKRLDVHEGVKTPAPVEPSANSTA